MGNDVNQERFLLAYNKIVRVERERNGIGTLGEKTMHAVLKNYYEPDEEKQEIKIGTYVADIFTGAEIVEIQTRQLNKLREKLATFLGSYPVTVVHPIAGKKWVYWVNLETGEVSKGRVSPKHGTVFDAFYELYKIKPFLVQEGVTIRIPVLTVEEYKYLNGWGCDKKRGASRMDRIPVKMEEEMVFRGVADYAALVPEELSDKFTCKEFAQHTKIRVERAQNVVHILCFVGAVRRVGKEGRAYVYERNEKYAVSKR